jgi:hypothetical protein
MGHKYLGVGRFFPALGESGTPLRSILPVKQICGGTMARFLPAKKPLGLQPVIGAYDVYAQKKRICANHG